MGTGRGTGTGMTHPPRMMMETRRMKKGTDILSYKVPQPLGV
jgi:hypothetical protein